MTVPNQDPPGLDLVALRSYLDGELPGLVVGRLAGEVIPGGRSNLTYVVTDGVSRWVVRRPPLGHVLATAHDMAREFRVLSALGPTVIPVPATLTLCGDDAVIGAPFYVMEYVPGTVFRLPKDLDPLPPDRVRALALSMVDILVALHGIDPEAVGLGDFGRPEGYNERQVRRWKKQLDASRSREVAGIDTLHDALATSVPGATAGTIVHGDYRLSNVLVGAGDTIDAVLDWEMSTLGDPLADLGLMLVYTGYPLEGREVTTVEGHPTLSELVAHYAEVSGRDVTGLRWYVAFAAFKLAVILEGVHYRYQQGKTVGPGFEKIGERVPGLVRMGLDTLDGGGHGLRL